MCVCRCVIITYFSVFYRGYPCAEMSLAWRALRPAHRGLRTAAAGHAGRISHAEPSRNRTCVRVQFVPPPNAQASLSCHVELHRDWIADNSAEHRDSQTSQKIRSVVDLDATREVVDAAVGDDNTLAVSFSDGTCNTLSGDWIANVFLSQSSSQTAPGAEKMADPFDPTTSWGRNPELLNGRAQFLRKGFASWSMHQWPPMW